MLLVTIEECRRDFRVARAYVEWLMGNANRWFADRRCSFGLLWRCIRLALGLTGAVGGLDNCLCNLPARTARIIQAAGRRLSEWPFRNGQSPGLTAWIELWRRQLLASYLT